MKKLKRTFSYWLAWLLIFSTVTSTEIKANYYHQICDFNVQLDSSTNKVKLTWYILSTYDPIPTVYIDGVEECTTSTDDTEDWDTGTYYSFEWFDDKTVDRDKANPVISDVSAIYNANTGNIDLSWSIVDEGTECEYAVKTEESDSGPAKITCTSGIDKCYVCYNGSKYSTDNKYSVPLESFSDVVIEALDKAGNKSTYSVPNITITGDAPQSTISKPKYSTFDELGLPDSETRNTNYGEINFQIQWDSSTYNCVADTQSISGSYTNVSSSFTESPTDRIIKLEDVVIGDINNIIDFPTAPNQKKTQTLYKVAPNLESFSSSQVKVHTNGTQISLPITWDTSTLDTSFLGSQRVYGTVSGNEHVDIDSNVKPYMDVEVISSTLSSVTNPASKSVIAHTAFSDLELPNTVDVTFSNGQIVACDVTWDSSDYNSTDVNVNQTITGTLTLPYGYTNPTDEKASIIVKVLPYSVGSINQLSTINTTYKTPWESITKPTTVTVNGTNGKSEDVSVEFDSSKYDCNKIGVQSIPGTYKNIPATIDESTLPEVFLLINVENSELISVEAQSAKEVEAYTTFEQLNLPSTVDAKFNNGQTVACNVTWNEATYSDTKIDSVQTITGILTMPYGYTNSIGAKTSVSIKVKPYKVASIDIGNGLNVTVPYRVPWENITKLSTIKVTGVNGRTDNVEVEFTNTSYDSTMLSGEQIFSGRYINVPDTIDASTLPTPKIIIKVRPTELQSLTSPTDKVVQTYTTFEELGLPSKIQAQFEENLSVDLDVDWDESTYNNTKVERQIITGTVNLTEGYINPSNIKVSVTVDVKPYAVATIDQPDKSNTSNNLYLTVEYKTPWDSITKPSKIKVTGEGDRVDMLDVEFNKADYSNTTLGEQVIRGTFKNIPTTIDATSLPEPLMVIKVLSANASKVESIPDKTVESYTTFEQLNLPSEVEVSFSNGEDLDCAIEWNEYTYDNTKVDEVQEVIGNIVIPENYVNTLNLKAVVNVKVNPYKVVSIETSDALYINTDYNVSWDKLNKPANIKVFGNGNRENEVSVVFNSAEFSPTTLGLQTITGVFKNVPNTIDSSTLPTPKMQILVEKSPVTSIEKALSKSVEVYTTFEDLELPNKSKVHFRNGDVLDCDTTWDSSEYDNTSTTDNMTLHGNILLPTGYINDTNKQAEINIKINPAESCVIDTGQCIDVFYNTQLKDISIPSKIKVTTKSGHTDTLKVDFDTTSYNPKLLGKQTFIGQFKDIPETIDSATLPTPELIINVKEIEVVSVELIEQKIVQAYDTFESLGLPQELEITFNNGERVKLPVTWNTSYFDNANINNVQLVTGDIKLSYGYSNLLSIKAACAIKVEPFKIASIEIAKPDNNNGLYQEIEFGTPIENVYKPTSIMVTAENGHQEKIKVVFNIEDYKQFQLGEQIFDGTWLDINNLVDTSTLPIPQMIINVSPTEIVSIEKIPPVHENDLGTDSIDKVLSKEVTVTLASGVKYKIPVEYSTKDFDKTTTKVQIFTAELKLPEGIKNTNNITYEEKVKLKPVEGGREVINYKALDKVKAPVNGDPNCIALKDKVELLLNSGETIIADISSWDMSKTDLTQPGQTTVEAILKPSNDYVFKKPIKIEQTIEVVVPSAGQMVQLLPLDPIQVLPDGKIEYPTKQYAILEDGTIIEIPIKVKPVEVDLSKPGVYYAEVEILYPSNPFDLKSEVEIDVIDIFEMTRNIVKVKNPPAIKAELGTSFGDLRFSKASVRLSNNQWIPISVSPKESNYNSSKTEVQLLESDLLLPYGIKNPLNLKTYASVILEDYSGKSEEEKLSHMTIKELVSSKKIIVDYDTPYTRISTPDSLVKMMDNTVKYIPTAWSFVNYNPNKIGEIEITGTLIIDDSLNPNKVRGLTYLTVLKDYRDLEGNHTIAALNKLSTVTKEKGQVLNYSELPQTVKCILRDGTVKDIPVTWDYKAISINMDTTIHGKLDIPEGMYIACESVVTIEVKCTKSSSSGSPANSNSDIPVKPQQEVIDTTLDSSPAETEPKIENTAKQTVPESMARIPFSIPSSVDFKSNYKIEDNVILDVARTDSNTTYTMTIPKLNLALQCQAVTIIPTEIDFVDVQKTHWAYKFIKEISQRGYAKGISSNKFNPSSSITLADTCTFLDRVLLNNNHYEIYNDRNMVMDNIKVKNHWAYYNVASIASKTSTSTLQKILKVNKIEDYKNTLTREQVAVILTDILNRYELKAPNVVVNYSDFDEITYKSEVKYCSALGIFEGSSNGKFNPTAKITRAELVTVLIRLDNILKNSKK